MIAAHVLVSVFKAFPSFVIKPETRSLATKVVIATTTHHGLFFFPHSNAVICIYYTHNDMKTEHTLTQKCPKLRLTMSVRFFSNHYWHASANRARLLFTACRLNQIRITTVLYQKALRPS